MWRYLQERRERKAAFAPTEIPALWYSGATKQGSRKNNQDNLRLGNMVQLTEPMGPFAAAGWISLDRTQVFCVCDGIGGGEKGELAAWVALRAICECFEQINVEETELQDVVLEAAEAAQSGVLDLYRSMGATGGCTLTMIALRGREYEFLNIGDSPAFYYDKARRKLRELSVRHDTRWQYRVNGDELPEGERVRLVNFIGREGFMAAQLAHTGGGELRCGDGIVLCSDGVTNAFSRRRLKRAIKKRMDANRMTDRAERKAGADNCTAICLRVERCV